MDYTVSKRYDELMGLLCARQRRRFGRGLSRKHSALLKKLKKARANCDETGRPETVRTHLRDMIIVPEMIGSVVGVYNGKDFVLIEVKVSAPARGAAGAGSGPSRWVAARSSLPLLRRGAHGAAPFPAPLLPRPP